jgi:hypothetical protein
MDACRCSLWEFVGSVRFHRVSDLSPTTNPHAFITLLAALIATPCWHAVCTNAGQQTRLASRGGRNPTSTGVPVLGGQFRRRGLAPAPFFIFSVVSCFPRVSGDFQGAGLRSCAVSFLGVADTFRSKPTPLANSGSRYNLGSRGDRCQKGERPTGGSAARAWGMGGYVARSQSGSLSRVGQAVGCSAALASSRTTHRSRHPITIRMAPRVELTSDHLVILPGASREVDSPGGSNPPVLKRRRSASPSGTNVLPLDSSLRSPFQRESFT